MRVLIVGSDTPVGSALSAFFDERERDYVLLPKADCRWKSERQAKKSLRRSGCDITVDCRIQAAADGGIRVHDIDVDRSRWLATASRGLQAPFIHLSCARVFTGTAQHPYREDDHPDGHSTIAELLGEAELAVRTNCDEHVILRLGPVFSGVGINVVTHMLRQLNQGQRLELGRRQLGCPLPAEDAARVISGVVDQLSCGLPAWGIYHYCSSDITNCFEFAEVLLAAASQYRDLGAERVQFVPEQGEPLVRNLNCDKIKSTFAIKQQPWRANVAGQVKEFYAREALEDTTVVQGN